MAPVQHAESGDGTRIGYRAGGSGEPLVMVHGAATSSADWLLALPHLRESFTVVTMDRRGRGQSADGPDYSMEREADDILAVLEATGSEMLVGHSYGALCSIVLAARGPRLRKLVLYEPPIAVQADWLAGLDDLVASGDLDTALTGFLRGADVPEDQFDLIRSSPAWPVLLEAVPVLPRELHAAAAWHRPQGPIDIPTLYLLGGDTTKSSYLEGLDQVQAVFTDLRQEHIPGQHHVGHVFAAEAFAKLVTDFCEKPA